jgi:flagellar hook protein FlgE
MYAGVSGLRSHQIMMDVVGNNISNVNTQGYKRSTALFADVLSQIDNAATAPTDNLGGRNPSQVGLGVQVSGTAVNFGQGFLQITNRELDVAIQGDGFFVHNVAGEQLYTRNGALFMDAEGRLVTSQGGLVQGWQADDAGVITTTGPVDTITLPIGDQNLPVITTEVKIGGNLPSNAPIGEQAFAGVDVYGESGDAILLNLTFEKTAVDEWTVSATYGDPPNAVALTDNVIDFTVGELTNPADFNINIADGVIPELGAVDITIGGDGERRITQYGDSNTVSVITQDGAPPGVLQSMRVAPDGVVLGTYSNGLTGAIARLAIANFSNPEGLERVTGTNFRGSPNSGLAQIGVTGTGGRGLIAPGTLEMSNVDLALEFTEMIRSQRGFLANSRVVTSADELLQEIVNLKR